MKRIVYFILFIVLTLFSNNIFALEIEYNTEYNVKKAILVEDYIKKHKVKIENFIDKYNIVDKSNLTKDIEELNKSIKTLKKIQNTNIKKKIAEEVIKAIILKIKNVNESLKFKLENEKEKFKNKLKLKKQVYLKLGVKLSKKIDSINIKIATNIFKNKTVLSLKESKIKLNLIRLNKESIKLKNFGNNEFKSEKEIKDSFIMILTNIKKEIELMKHELR